MLNLVNNAAKALGDATGEIRLTTRPRRPPRPLGAVLHSFDPPAGDCACLELAATGQGLTPARSPGPSIRSSPPNLPAAACASPPSSASCTPIAAPPPSKAPPRSVRPFASISPSPPARRRARPAPHRRNLFNRADEPVEPVTADALLRHTGFQTVPAADGHEAVQPFRASPQRIAAVLPDLTRPGRDGAEVLRVIRALHPDVSMRGKSR